MFPTELRNDRLAWIRNGRVARVAVLCAGLGLGTAAAAELTITPGPDLQPVTDAGYAASDWSYFDPGFLVDHLPFKLTVGQSISYNDNVANLPRNSALLAGTNTVSLLPSRGDFYSDTTLSVASRFPMGAQTFFFNGTYAPRRYFTDTAINADNYAINGGVDFNVADRCAGRLVAGVDQNQTPLAQSVGYGVQESMSTSFNETARCKVTGHVAALLNSGVSRIEQSGTQLGALSGLNLALNNYDQYYIGGGLEYALSSLDTLRGITTFTHRSFFDRPVVAGLFNETDQQDLQAYYSRVFSAKLDGSASAGVSLFSFPGSSGVSSEPIYSFILNYRPTPKIAVSGTVARSAGAPQTAISNIQVSDSQSLSLSYTYSPKLNVTGVVSHSTSRNPGVANALTSAVLFANSDNDTASVVVNYQATPLITATAAYSYTSRSDTSRSGLDAVSNVFRVGLVYTR